MTLLFLFRLILSDMETIQEMRRELILLRYRAIRFLQLKPRANGRKHCRPTTPNVVRCYMLGPVAHLVAC